MKIYCDKYKTFHISTSEILHFSFVRDRNFVTDFIFIPFDLISGLSNKEALRVSMYLRVSRVY